MMMMKTEELSWEGATVQPHDFWKEKSSIGSLGGLFAHVK